MLGNFGRRAIDLAVLFLALYAFAFVPLGTKTGLEHVVAIVHTDAARAAATDLRGAADRLVRRLLDTNAEEPLHPRGTARVPRLPKHRPEPPANAALSPLIDAPDASM